MKNTIRFMTSRVTVFVALCFVGMLASCSKDTPTGTNNTFKADTVKFKLSSSHYFNLFLVDTADKNGNNADKVITDSAQYNRQEITVDTALNYKGFFPVTRMIFASNLPDTNYYHQDASGNLWRYNYGFNVMNKFQTLIIALGAPIDVGWVLVAKPGAPEGTTWVGKSDSSVIPSYGTVYLKDIATVQKDTTIIVAANSIKTQHVRHLVTASAAGNLATGTIIVDTYISPELGTTVMDFFYHSEIRGILGTINARGSQKIMIQ